ncbi:MAG: AraC family transcriptional regulator [Prevotella sp.]|nr:AraC family transcriptional regulator [Prevotella sp.]
MSTTLYIKNMVCDRCKRAVSDTLRQAGLTPESVELGVATVKEAVEEPKRKVLEGELHHLGFELLDDRRLQTIERIKNSVIELVHYNDSKTPLTLSNFLTSKLGGDYSALSKLFSEYAGMTIERYYILQRVERVKELLFYDELTLSQIALKMNYSSTAYLSSQFKNVTGMTPTRFKQMKRNMLKPLDEI